jgi:hypothetical protein
MIRFKNSEGVLYCNALVVIKRKGLSRAAWMDYVLRDAMAG